MSNNFDLFENALQKCNVDKKHLKIGRAHV